MAIDVHKRWVTTTVRPQVRAPPQQAQDTHESDAWCPWVGRPLPPLWQLALLTLLAPLLSLAWGLLTGPDLPLGGGGGMTAAAARGSDNGTHDDMASLLTPEVAKLLETVDRDFQPWEQHGIALEQVEEMYCHTFEDMWRLQIIDGRAYVVGEARGYQTRSWHSKLQIQEMLERWPGRIPDVDFMIFVQDRPEYKRPIPEKRCHPQPAPLLAYNKLYTSIDPSIPPHTFVVLVPDFAWSGFESTLGLLTVAHWRQQLPLMRARAANVSWERRQERLLFRGSPYNPDRVLMYKSEAVQQSELLDIKWADGNVGPHLDTHVPLADHCGYKYLMHYQGNAWATRLKWIMACGSTVVIPRDPDYEWQEFWYGLLEHDVNVRYMPRINETERIPLLDQEVAWLREHDAEARRIGEAGARLMEEVLTYDTILLYWRAVLTKYASLQTFKVELHPDAVPLEAGLDLGPWYEWPKWWQCPRYRTCGRVCPHFPDKAPKAHHAALYPLEGSPVTDAICEPTLKQW